MRIIKGVTHLSKLAVTPSYQQPAKGAIWFFHGTCDSGPGLQTWLHDILHRKFNFHHHKILFPTAPVISYDLFDGKMVPVWYNRLKLSPECPEDFLSIEKSAASIGQLIKEQTEADGIPMSKVVLGGFSEGGSLALHLAYRLHTQVAGCFALSSFLPPDSRVFHSLANKMKNEMKKVESEAAKAIRATQESQSHNSPSKHSKIPIPSQLKPKLKNKPQPPSRKVFHLQQLKESPTFSSISKSTGTSSSIKTINPNPLSFHNIVSSMEIENRLKLKLPHLFMSHGAQDPLVYHTWAKDTFKKLRNHGVPGYFYTLPHLEHGIHPAQLHLLHNWIDGILKDKTKKTTNSNDDGNERPTYYPSDGHSGGGERSIYFWPQ